MGFTVEAASGRVLAIKAGKNNPTPVFVALDGSATLAVLLLTYLIHSHSP
jgi:hypothetical protein